MEKARELEPDNVEINNAIAALYIDMGKLEESEKIIESVLERDPGNVRGRQYQIAPNTVRCRDSEHHIRDSGYFGRHCSHQHRGRIVGLPTRDVQPYPRHSRQPLSQAVTQGIFEGPVRLQLMFVKTADSLCGALERLLFYSTDPLKSSSEICGKQRKLRSTGTIESIKLARVL